MIDALLSAQLALDTDQLKLQNINQNIANMNTPAYKQQILEVSSFDEQLQVEMNSVMNQTEARSINSQGTLKESKNPHELALNGPGYFQVQGKEGLMYTRRGDFQVNALGELTTASGELLLGQGGPLQVDGHDFKINSDGSVYIDKQKVDQLQIVSFEQSQALHYLGNGLYQSDASPTPCNNTRVLQGFLEQSNVTSVDEMMDMVKTSRHFEANQRVMHIADSLVATAIGQLGEGNV